MDPKLKRAFAREGRLWGLGVACAIPGALAASHYQSWWAGFAFFLATFAILGPMLWIWERRRRARQHTPGRPENTPPPARPPSVNQRYGQQKRPPRGPR